MPKAVKQSKTKEARAARDPIAKPKPSKDLKEAKGTERPPAAKDPKASHLYTDDNPATTVHGTGFKNQNAALKTLELISKRSLIYQFQTINTMFNRAKHHPSMKKKGAETSESTANMRAAMAVFRTWLDETYPTERDALRAGGFKPLLSKKVVERYLPQIEESEDVSDDAKAFAQMYAALAKGKRLGNVLVDEAKPEEPDFERMRYEALDGLVPAGKEDGPDAWKLSELWTDDREVAGKHLALVAWGWSPVAEAKLP